MASVLLGTGKPERRRIMKEKWLLERREAEGRTFFLLKVGSCRHGRPNFVVWVSPRLTIQTQDGSFIEFPIENVELIQGKKDLILRTGSRNLFNVFVRCGYRGESEIEVITPNCSIFEYEVWASPQGSLGVSRGALVLTDKSYVKYRWERTGRLYGATPTGTSIIHLDGTEEQIESEEDALASLE
jgi:hypothetical protein